MTQWSSDPNTLIVHGCSEIDDHHSFVSIVNLPRVGCISCKKMRENEVTEQPFKELLCVLCNLTIHLKYRFNESTQKFDPKIHLNAPGFVIMCENSLIHSVAVHLDMQKTINHGSGIINYKYLKMLSCDATSNVRVGQDHNNVVNNEKSPPDDIPSKQISIVEQILADFSEYDVECTMSPVQSQIKLLVPDLTKQGCENQNEMTVELSSQASNIVKITEGISMKPSSPTLLESDAASKTYEFSEENEKCEKISIFRKRRLADKKYEFSEENTENIVPFNRTRKRSLRRPIYHQYRSHPSFRSPCGSPVANRCIMSPPGFRSPNYYSYRSSPNYLMMSPTRNFMRISGGTTSGAVEDVHKFLDIMYFNTRESRSDEVFLEDVAPMFSKKIVNFYVEEDDANSVVTCEEDDCISPGYHLSLDMQVHGACYSKLQIVPKASLNRLKGIPRTIVTQNSFDVETFSIHVANNLCNKNNKSRSASRFDFLAVLRV